jgi:hypothetical protein
MLSVYMGLWAEDVEEEEEEEVYGRISALTLILQANDVSIVPSYTHVIKRFKDQRAEKLVARVGHPFAGCPFYLRPSARTVVFGDSALES